MRNPYPLPTLIVAALLLLGALAPRAARAQTGRYLTRFGLTTLFSATPVIDIEARNTKTSAVIDLGTGQVAVSLLMVKREMAAVCYCKNLMAFCAR